MPQSSAFNFTSNLYEGNTETMTPIISIIERLTSLRDQIILDSNLTKAELQQANELVQQLSVLGLWHENVCLGPVVLERAYGLNGPCDSGEIVQVAVSSKLGASVVFWNSEERYLADQADSLEVAAFDKAQPLTECKPAIQALAWPHVAKLLAKLTDSVKM